MVNAEAMHHQHLACKIERAENVRKKLNAVPAQVRPKPTLVKSDQSLPVRTPRAIETPAAEPWGANVLRAGGTVLVQAGCPRTADRVANAGYDVRLVDVSELAKAEGSLTCLSLLFDADLDGDVRVKRGT